MTSSRLPGKVLLQVRGTPLLEYLIERLKRCQAADRLIIATTKNKSDDPIIELCNSLSVDNFRGDEQDVLSRYYGAAVATKASVVVRVTADSPLIDPATIDKFILWLKTNQTQFDYVSNGSPPTLPNGMGCEVFSMDALRLAYQNAKSDFDKEHVTPYIIRGENGLRVGSLPHRKNLSDHRWTLDTQEDFKLIEKIISAGYPSHPHFTLEDIEALVEAHSEWMSINRMSKQVSGPYATLPESCS